MIDEKYIYLFVRIGAKLPTLCSVVAAAFAKLVLRLVLCAGLAGGAAD